MTSKFDMFRAAGKREHTTTLEFFTATFYNRAGGSYDPDEGRMINQTRNELASFDVELVPPAMDTTVSVGGTNLDFTTSIRFPQDRLDTNDLNALGEDNTRPTEVEISNPQESDKDVYELHGYSYENGSEMLMCRLVEQ